MATETIRIIVTTSGAPQASKQLLGVATAAGQAQKAVGFMNTALKATAAIALGRSLTVLIDTYTNLENRTKVFASSTLEARDAFRGVFDVALRARAPLDATGELFGRLQLALNGTGKSSADLLRITETVTKAIAISGATAQEADGALRQLAQGIAANRLSGQELNSVLEQTPIIARLLATELKVPVEQLRQLANKQGAITSEVIVRALENSAALIDELFSKTATTFSQAFEQMKTAVTLLFGEILRSTGIAQSFAEAISKAAMAIRALADNKESVANLGIAIKAVGVILAATATLMAVAWATTPIGAAAVAIGAVLALYLKYKDTIVEIGGVNQSVGLHISETWGGVVSVFKGVANVLKDVWELLKAINDIVPIVSIIGAGLENSGAGLALKFLRDRGESAALQAQNDKGIGPAVDLLAPKPFPAATEFNGATGFAMGSLQDQAASMGLRTDTSELQLRNDINKKHAEILAEVSAELEQGIRVTEEMARIEKLATEARDQASAKLRTAYQKIAEALNPATAAQREHAEAIQTVQQMWDASAISTAEYVQNLMALEKEYAATIFLMGEFAGAQATIVDAGKALVREAMTPQEEALENLLDQLKALEAAAYFDPKNASTYIKAQQKLTDEFNFQAIALENEAIALANVKSGLDELIEKQEKLEAARGTVSDFQGERNPAIGAFNDTRGKLEQLNEAARNSGGDAELLAEIAAEREMVLKKMEEDQQAITNPDLKGIEAFKDGATGALHELGQTFADESTIWKEGFESVFSTIGDAIKGFVETGKLDFRELGLAFAQEVSMMMAKMLALQALNAISTATAGSGGWLGAIGGIAGAVAGGARANGGPVDAGRSFIVGEHGPERFTPAVDGMVTPGAGGNVSISMNITTKDADSFRASKTQIESDMAGALARARQRNG